jgi:glycosyltransferase involved in cell wall biosynthesis
MESYCHFTGLQSEVRPFLSAMDIFMMTSQFEGLPIALLEAMSMGCVPACTAAGGIPEVVNEENGILVNVNKPEQLTARIGDLLQNWNSQGENKGRLSRDTVVQKFSLNKMVSELEKLYTSLL